MELTLRRQLSPNPDVTHGQLWIGSHLFCDTLEDRVREIAHVPVAEWKVQDRTAIPVGRYRMKLTFSPRFQKITPELFDVPGFSAIRIHSGNTEHDSSGCVLVGFRVGDTVHDSRRTMTKLMAALSSTSEPLWLTILPASADGPITASV